MRYSYEKPDGTSQLYDDGVAVCEAGEDVVPIETFYCVDGTGNHSLERVAYGAICTQPECDVEIHFR